MSLVGLDRNVSAEGQGVQYMRSSPFVAEIAGRCHGGLDWGRMF